MKRFCLVWVVAAIATQVIAGTRAAAQRPQASKSSSLTVRAGSMEARAMELLKRLNGEASEVAKTSIEPGPPRCGERLTVHFHNRAKVQFSPDGSQILSYTAPGAAGQPIHGAAPTMEIARKVADRVLGWVGAPKDLTLYEVEPSLHNGKIDMWAVNYSRVTNGTVPYQKQGAVVVVDVSGAIAGLSINYFTPPAAPARRVMTEATAWDVADQFLRNRLGPTGELTRQRPILEVVQPSDVWAPKPARTPRYLPSARVAWTLNYRHPERGALRISVDAENGQILDGHRGNEP